MTRAKPGARTARAHEGRCAYCLKQVKNLQAEHIVPVVNGGMFTPNNLVSACPTCNWRKGTISLLEMTALYGPNMNFVEDDRLMAGRYGRGRSTTYPAGAGHSMGASLRPWLIARIDEESRRTNKTRQVLMNEALADAWDIDLWAPRSEFPELDEAERQLKTA